MTLAVLDTLLPVYAFGVDFCDHGWYAAKIALRSIHICNFVYCYWVFFCHGCKWIWYMVNTKSMFNTTILGFWQKELNTYSFLLNSISPQFIMITFTCWWIPLLPFILVEVTNPNLFVNGKYFFSLSTQSLNQTLNKGMKFWYHFTLFDYISWLDLDIFKKDLCLWESKSQKRMKKYITLLGLGW